jgi:hypothetical protein
VQYIAMILPAPYSSTTKSACPDASALNGAFLETIV